ncbi:hypothetical protein PFHG_05343 [Plasmodium falciparum HB3]|uniref:Uncharacterized protein n=1 Tax=Plasmodium falciparum (isolate HB3) TaxID=137071 RepID=A0A0L7KKC9_PLAFX|nr:hypothetical protein PFHG_05343 [Plasmodium falciparum HB3]
MNLYHNIYKVNNQRMYQMIIQVEIVQQIPILLPRHVIMLIIIPILPRHVIMWKKNLLLCPYMIEIYIMEKNIVIILI